jgi:uncharacterized protein (TIGR02598 family)
MKRLPAAVAFSLVELTLALGIAAFCLVTVFALVPVGVQTNRNATSQTAATNILSSVVSDIRASPPGQTKSARYQINRSKGVATAVCFDGQGRSTTLPLNVWTCPANYYRFRLYVKITNDISGGVVYPTYAWLKVTWPAAPDPIHSTITPSGSVETVAAFFVK